MEILRCGGCAYNRPENGIIVNGVPRNMCIYDKFERGVSIISPELIGESVKTTDNTLCLYGFTLETLPPTKRSNTDSNLEKVNS
jgi:hypothetical protein